MVLGNTISHAGTVGTTVGKDAAISLYNPDQTNIVMEYNVLAPSKFNPFMVTFVTRLPV